MADDSVTIWQSTSGRHRDLLMARSALSISLALGYGIFNFVRLGASGDHYLFTYVLVVGGIASLASLFWFGLATSFHRRSYLLMLGAFAGFIPYLFGIYLVSVTGVYGIWLAFGPFNIWGILAGLFWLYAGYRLVHGFWLISELVNAPYDGRGAAEYLASEHGVSSGSIGSTIRRDETIAKRQDARDPRSGPSATGDDHPGR